MFGIGMTELLVILAVALIVFGPQRLPELARSLGRALGEFRRASSDLRQHIDEAAEAARVEPLPEPEKRAVGEVPGPQAAKESSEAGSPTPGDAPDPSAEKGTAPDQPAAKSAGGANPSADAPPAATPAGTPTGEAPEAPPRSSAAPAPEGSKEPSRG